MSTVYVLPWLGVSLYSINTLSCPYSKVFGLFVTIHEFAAGLQEFGISVTIYSQPWLHVRFLGIWPVSVNIHILTWTRNKFPGTWPVPVTIYSLHWPCNKFPGTWPVPVTIYSLPWTSRQVSRNLACLCSRVLMLCLGSWSSFFGGSLEEVLSSEDTPPNSISISSYSQEKSYFLHSSHVFFS